MAGSGRGITTDHTARLAAWTSSVGLEDLSPRVVEVLGVMLADCLAVAVAGSVEPGVNALRAVERPRCWHGGDRRPLAEAMATAVVLSSAAHALDFDDIHLAMGGHPSSAIIGAVMGAASMTDATGEDIVAGFAVGVETAARIGRAISAGHYHVGWHPTSVIGALASAFAASRVLRLDEGTTRRAVGLAAAMASGTKANFGTFAKPLQVGAGSRSGLIGAAYAAGGIEASTTILDDQHGAFTRLFTESVEEQVLTDGLGERFSLLDPEPVIKLIPACGGVHASTWCAIDLAREHDIDASQVSEVTAEVHPKRIPHTDRSDASTGLQGKFSTQYCVGVGLLQRSVGLRDFEDDVVLEPDRQAMMRRVSLVAAPDAEEWPGSDAYATGSRSARVTVRMFDGRVIQGFLDAPPGYPGNPASDAQNREKFVDCASRVVSKDKAGGWFAALGRLTSDPEEQRATLLEVVTRVITGRGLPDSNTDRTTEEECACDV